MPPKQLALPECFTAMAPQLTPRFCLYEQLVVDGLIAVVGAGPKRRESTPEFRKTAQRAEAGEIRTKPEENSVPGRCGAW
jgi:hypothetical protein